MTRHWINQPGGTVISPAARRRQTFQIIASSLVSLPRRMLTTVLGWRDSRRARRRVAQLRKMHEDRAASERLRRFRRASTGR